MTDNSSSQYSSKTDNEYNLTFNECYMMAFKCYMLWYAYVGVCVAMSMQRQFAGCHKIGTNQLGSIMFTSLITKLVSVTPFQFVSILHAK